MTTFTLKQPGISITPAFIALLQKTLEQKTIEGPFCSLHFKDSSYSAEQGGFHPVEIGLNRVNQNHWELLYITEYAYYSGVYPELERCIDFDISNQMAYTQMSGWQDIRHREIRELYQLWEGNFLSYVESGSLDEIQVRAN
ncbi:DUF2787 family protein [Celerinatantimonas sp. YJH-8]|uniref:DUF2787 family protein n=1 Tax=Celerinatantimonas sp. YJH-8 TaxID=3228714 RepID=UPI0038C0B327